MENSNPASGASAAPAVDEATVRDWLRRVIDPEMAINIIDLGLVYRIDIGPRLVRVEMTMTSPACPMGQMIMDDALDVLAMRLPVGCRPEIALVWEPPWSPELMSEKSRRSLGWDE